MDIKTQLPKMRDLLGLRVLTYLTRGNKVLLGQRKEGIGKGNFVGIGGKIDPGETQEQAAVRELFEEIGVTVDLKNLVKKGNIKFLFPHNLKWSQEIIPYTCSIWEGEPIETEEIKPVWFEIDNLPLDMMWADAPLWLPRIVRGQILDATFLYNEASEVIDYQILT